MDKFLRRQLIRSGNEVIQLGFDKGLPLEEILDKAEQKIFAISQEKPSKGLIPTAEILTSTFNEIESRSLGTSVAGIPVNFYDLDAMTQGLQRSRYEQEVIRPWALLFPIRLPDIPHNLRLSYMLLSGLCDPHPSYHLFM